MPHVAGAVKAGSFTPPVGKTFGIDDIGAAHRTMDSASAGGTIVVTAERG